jgi:aspartate aminotransferase
MRTDPSGSPDLQFMVRTFRERRDVVLETLKDIPGLKANVPSGAFYVLPEVSAYFGKSCNGRRIDNATDLSNYLLEEAHVALVAGDAFGVPGCIRISYANSLELIIIAMSRIRTALAALS